MLEDTRNSTGVGNPMSNLVPFNEREHGTTFNHFSNASLHSILSHIKHTKWNVQKWRGLTLMKDPMSLSIYQQMLQDQRFKTIIEVGTYEGGAALWLEDVNKSIGNSCTIYTIDIDEDRVNLPAESSVIFEHLDVYNIEEFDVSNIEHPVLVIEDAHENLEGVMAYFDLLLQPGDYLVIEDTISNPKYEQVKNFIQDKPYLVDTTYCDMWGYNNSFNLNSIFKKV